MLPLILLSALAPSQDAPRVRESSGDTVLEWNEIALEAIRRDRTPPPIAARNLAILHAAIYDSVNTIEPRWAAFRVYLKRNEGESISTEAAVAACGSRVLENLYPRQARSFDRALQRALERIPAGRPRTLGLGVGRFVADRMLAWRRDDALDTYTAYRLSNDPGVWRPTPPNFDAAILPAYGRTARFCVPDRFDPKFVAPPSLSSDEYKDDLAEVRRLGGMDSTTRTADQTLIAEFWNDGAGTCTPPGHWNQIARIAALDGNFDLPRNARMFALLNLALADAAVVCWECKYRYRLWRPVTTLRQADRDWTPLLVTPAFPSYTSGHSTFSGAAAAVLADVCGKDGVEFTVGSDGVPGAERAYKGFWEAAREAGRSRVYGGIHYECDNREGLALGKRVAEEILATRLAPLVEDATRPARPPRGDDGAVPRRLPRGDDTSARRDRP